MSKRYNTKEAATFLKNLGTPFSPGTLEVWRCRGEGPQYIRIRRRIYYSEKALQEFSLGLTVETIDSMGNRTA